MTVLQNVTTVLPTGKLIAIMGPSGGGKTSLLNALANRLPSNATASSGKILFNGKERRSKSFYEKYCGYVTQQDFLLPYLTVRETLNFAAKLRLSDSKRAQIVEEVISELGLKECSNTRIGDETVKGISGGQEKKINEIKPP